MRPFLPEIRAWTEHNHYNILHPLLRSVFAYYLEHWYVYKHIHRLLARGMEIPEETFVDVHHFNSEEAPGETWGTSSTCACILFADNACTIRIARFMK